MPSRPPSRPRPRLFLALSLILVAAGCADYDSDGPADGDDPLRWGDKADDTAPSCPAIPDRASPSPPTVYSTACSYMDWNLSPDGFYILSQFGTTYDGTTMGRNTSCGALQTHYAGQCCMFDVDSWQCFDRDASGQQKQRKFSAPRGPGEDQCHPEDIPETGPPFLMDKTRTSSYWYTRRSIDFSYWKVRNDVKKYYFDDDGELLPPDQTSDFPKPEYFYVAGAQRYGCDAYLRVTNPVNNRCIVVFADDGGPGSRWEQDWAANRRILDSSPAVAEFLGTVGSGWKKGDLLYVEWGQPGDEPGDQCEPCTSIPAKTGTEVHRSPFDLTQAFKGTAECRDDDVVIGQGEYGGSELDLIDGLLPDGDPADADAGPGDAPDAGP